MQAYFAEKDQIKKELMPKDKPIYRTMLITQEGFLAEQVKGVKPSFLLYNHVTRQVSSIASSRIGEKEYLPLDDDLVNKNVINLPSAATEYGTTEALRQEVKRFIHTYLDIGIFYEDIASYYVLLTWLFDRLDTITYLGIYGEYGTGKTRAAKTIGTLCYKSAMVSGSLTTAPIYRILEQSRGTLILNEFDFDNSDFNNELIKILNNGYEQGMHVLRTNKDSGKVECFDAFSPKIFTYRKKKKDLAFESRLITINIAETHRDDIPTVLPKYFETEAQVLRNKLLLFRFHNYRSSVSVDSSLFKGIERRIQQTLYPLFSVVADLDFQRQLINFARNMQEQVTQDRGLSWEADAFQSLLDLIKSKKSISVGDFANALTANQVFGEGVVNSRKAGSIVRTNLKLQTDRCTAGENKGQRVIVIDRERIVTMCQKFGIEIPAEPSLQSLPSLTSYQESEHSEGGEQSEGSELLNNVIDALM